MIGLKKLQAVSMKLLAFQGSDGDVLAGIIKARNVAPSNRAGDTQRFHRSRGRIMAEAPANGLLIALPGTNARVLPIGHLHSMLEDVFTSARGSGMYEMVERTSRITLEEIAPPSQVLAASGIGSLQKLASKELPELAHALSTDAARDFTMKRDPLDQYALVPFASWNAVESLYFAISYKPNDPSTLYVPGGLGDGPVPTTVVVGSAYRQAAVGHEVAYRFRQSLEVQSMLPDRVTQWPVGRIPEGGLHLPIEEVQAGGPARISVSMKGLMVHSART